MQVWINSHIIYAYSWAWGALCVEQSPQKPFESMLMHKLTSCQGQLFYSLFHSYDTDSFSRDKTFKDVYAEIYLVNHLQFWIWLDYAPPAYDYLNFSLIVSGCIHVSAHELICKAEIKTDIENGHMGTRDGGRGRVGWIGRKGLTYIQLLCIK